MAAPAAPTLILVRSADATCVKRTLEGCIYNYEELPNVPLAQCPPAPVLPASCVPSAPITSSNSGPLAGYLGVESTTTVTPTASIFDSDYDSDSPSTPTSSSIQSATLEFDSSAPMTQDQTFSPNPTNTCIPTSVNGNEDGEADVDADSGAEVGDVEEDEKEEEEEANEG